MSEIRFSEIQPDGIEVTQILVADTPFGWKEVEIYAHRIDVPTGISPSRSNRIRVSDELFEDANRDALIASLKRHATKLFRE